MTDLNTDPNTDLALAVILDIQRITFEAPRDSFNPEDIMMQDQALKEIWELVKDFVPAFANQGDDQDEE
jgi:hypothetical protein